MQAKTRLLLWIALIAVLAVSACAPILPAPVASEPPSSTPDLVMTGLVQTLTAAPPFTATVEETSTIAITPQPSNTLLPTITPFPSGTSIVASTPTSSTSSGVSVTSTGTPDSGYACQLTLKTPGNWTIFAPGSSFDANWKVKNTGTEIWKAGGAISMMYIDGAKLQKSKSFKSFLIPADVIPGDTTTLLVDMLAPKFEGAQVSNWGLVVNSTKLVFCKLSIRIIVQKK